MKQIKKIAHKLFQITGKDFVNYSFENFVSLRRKKIILSKQINLVLDIGANKGTYGQEIRNTNFSGRIVSFEPLAEPFNQLKHTSSKDNLWSCENIAVGNFEGEASINISGRVTSSSLLKITERHVNAMPSSSTVHVEKIQVARLDSLYSKFVKPYDRIYMKLDVQGYEREVLKGATETLKQTHVLEVELSMVPMYEGAPVLSEMLTLLEGMGYVLVSFAPVFSDPQTGHLLQADGIFVKQEFGN